MKIIRNGKIVRLAAGGGVRAGLAGARRAGGGVNWARPGAIKVNQAKSRHFFEKRDETEGFLADCGDGPSPPRGIRDELVGCQASWKGSWSQSACCAGKVRRSATDSTSHGFRGVNGT